jgi:hypothetical protein
MTLSFLSSRLLPVLATCFVTSLATAQLSCGMTSAGESCGPQLSVTFTPNGSGGNFDMVMTGTGLHPNAMGGFIWGGAPQAALLPGGCSVLCDYVWGHYFQTDATGSASWGRSWPHWAAITFFMQMASLEILPNGELSVLTTNCKIAGCL